MSTAHKEGWREGQPDIEGQNPRHFSRCHLRHLENASHYRPESLPDKTAAFSSVSVALASDTAR